jgi:hypothetical protein
MFDGRTTARSAPGTLSCPPETISMLHLSYGAMIRGRVCVTHDHSLPAEESQPASSARRLSPAPGHDARRARQGQSALSLIFAVVHRRPDRATRRCGISSQARLCALGTTTVTTPGGKPADAAMYAVPCIGRTGDGAMLLNSCRTNQARSRSAGPDDPRPCATLTGLATTGCRRRVRQRSLRAPRFGILVQTERRAGWPPARRPDSQSGNQRARNDPHIVPKIHR